LKQQLNVHVSLLDNFSQLLVVEVLDHHLSRSCLESCHLLHFRRCCLVWSRNHQLLLGVQLLNLLLVQVQKVGLWHAGFLHFLLFLVGLVEVDELHQHHLIVTNLGELVFVERLLARTVDAPNQHCQLFHYFLLHRR